MAEEIKNSEVIVNGETPIDDNKKEVKKNDENVVAESTTMNDAVSNVDAVDTIQKEKKSEEKLETTTTPKKVKRNAPKTTPTNNHNGSNGDGDETATGSGDTTADTSKGNSKEASKDDVKPWDTKVPTTKEEVIAELRTHSGMAENVAIAMVNGLIAAKDPALREDYIRHISWHLATGGPTIKINGSKGKAKHKKDIVNALYSLVGITPPVDSDSDTDISKDTDKPIVDDKDTTSISIKNDADISTIENNAITKQEPTSDIDKGTRYIIGSDATKNIIID